MKSPKQTIYRSAKGRALTVAGVSRKAYAPSARVKADRKPSECISLSGEALARATMEATSTMPAPAPKASEGKASEPMFYLVSKAYAESMRTGSRTSARRGKLYGIFATMEAVERFIAQEVWGRDKEGNEAMVPKYPGADLYMSVVKQ